MTQLYFFNKSGSLLWSQKLEYNVDAVSVSPEGEYIAAGCPTVEDLFLFANNGSLLLETPFYISIKAVSVSANANRIAVGDLEKITVIDRMANIICEREIDYYMDIDVAITADGKYVAFCCGDNAYYMEALPPSEITCTISKSEIAFGESVTVSGNVTPPVVDVQLTLTYTRPDSSNVTRTAITDQYGLYSDTYTPDMVGVWKVKASWIGNEQYAGSESSLQSFTVGKSSIMCDVSPETIFLGSSVTVNGSINPQHSSVQVTLVYKLYFQNSSYNYEGFVKETRNVTTLADGTFLDAFTPSQEGRWRVECSWAGDADHMPSQTETLFAVNSAAQISLLSATPVTLYWHRQQWYCVDGDTTSQLLDMEIPTSSVSATATFNPGDYWWIGHGHYAFKRIHTGQLPESILIEEGLWNLSIWAAALGSSEHFLVSLNYWDENHKAHQIASWNTGYFNSTSPDMPTEFAHSFNLTAQIIPKGGCLGFIIYDCRDSYVKWFFDSTLHPSYLTISSSTEVVTYTLNIMPATDGNTSPASGVYTYIEGTEVAIARALIHDPKVLFLDEPTANLDPESAETVRDFILELKKEKRTIFLCTHNLDEAERICDRIGVIKTRLIAVGSPSSLRRGLWERKTVIHLDRVDDKILDTVGKLSVVHNVQTIDNKLILDVNNPEKDNPVVVNAVVKVGGKIQFVTELRPTLEDVYLKLVREAETK